MVPYSAALGLCSAFADNNAEKNKSLFATLWGQFDAMLKVTRITSTYVMKTQLAYLHTDTKQNVLTTLIVSVFFCFFLQWLDKVVRKPALSNNSINNALYTNGCRTVEKKLIQNWQEIHRGDSRSSRDDQLSILVLKQKRHKDMKALTVSIIIIRINLFFSHLKKKKKLL